MFQGYFKFIATHDCNLFFKDSTHIILLLFNKSNTYIPWGPGKTKSFWQYFSNWIICFRRKESFSSRFVWAHLFGLIPWSCLFFCFFAGLQHYELYSHSAHTSLSTPSCRQVTLGQVLKLTNWWAGLLVLCKFMFCHLYAQATDLIQ